MAVLDLSKSDYIDLREFVHGFFKVYYSNLETKIKLSFDIYDFDRDGYITKEDVRLILSHIPIVNTMTGKGIKEGAFTQEEGNNVVFLDRIQTQEEIQLLITQVFGEKKRINYEDYVKINQEISSEMFLSILILFQTNLPCSVNYYRYKNNYEKYVDVDGKTDSTKDQGVVKTIASPRLMSKLSPVANLVNSQGINVNPLSQKGLLKYAMNKQQVNEINFADDNSDEDMDVDHSKFASKKDKAAAKAARAAELAKMTANGEDKINDIGAIRLPNRISKGMYIDPKSGTAKAGNDRDALMSPTSFLKGAASPRLTTFVAGGEDEAIQFEGEMIRKATETKLKKYWYCLLGKELYVYKNKQEEKHKGMHNLVGVFIKDEPEEHLDSTTVLYPFSLIFPGNKPRMYYLLDKEAKEKWIEAIKKVIGYSNLFDFYDVKETLGKGKFGLVKTAVHKKTGKRVAVKVMSKKEMTV